MKTSIYDIIYHLSGETYKESCSNHYLTKYITDIQQKGGTISFIYMKPANIAAKKINPDKIEINKYYNSKYSSFYKKYKREKITKKQFDEIVKKLKQFKNESSSKSEFEMKFEKYKKNTNNISPYSVSD